MIWGLSSRLGPLPEFADRLFELPDVWTAMLVGALQAGLVEEPVFRLLTVPAVYLFVSNMTGTPRWAALGAAVAASGVAFAMVPSHHPVAGFVAGSAMAAAYLKLGLVPLVAAHVVGVLVAWPLILGLW